MTLYIVVGVIVGLVVGVPLGIFVLDRLLLSAMGRR